MYSVGLEEGHEPQRGALGSDACRSPVTGAGFHQVEEGQRKQSPCSSEKGPALNFPISAHLVSDFQNTLSRNGALFATSIRSSFQVEFFRTALLAISSTTG